MSTRSTDSGALLQRLSRLQHALKAEKELSKRTERELAQLHGLARAKRASPRRSAHAPAYVSADLAGFCTRPTQVLACAKRGQLGRRNTDITQQQEQAGTSSNMGRERVYRPKKLSAITWQYEQYHCAKQSPNLVDVTSM